MIVVSDGSADRTNDILGEWQKSGRRALLLPEHQGKANALNHGMAAADGEIICFTDARQTIAIDGLKNLIANFADPSVGCASGALIIGQNHSASSSEGVGLYWRLEKNIRNWEALAGSTVGATGAFYAVRSSLLSPLPAGTILDDVYIPLQVARNGGRVVFDFSAVAWDDFSPSPKQEFRRKVRTLAGNYQLLQLAPWVLTSAESTASSVGVPQTAAPAGAFCPGGCSGFHDLAPAGHVRIRSRASTCSLCAGCFDGIACQGWRPISAIEYIARVYPVEYGSRRRALLLHYGQEGSMGSVTTFDQNDPGNVIAAAATGSVGAKRRIARRKPLVGAYVALVLFMVIYYGRPEDWIPGLSNVPLAKIAGILALLGLIFSLPHIRNRFPREVIYLSLLIGQLFLASLFSPVWRGGAVMMTLDFAKILLIFLIIITAVNTMQRLRVMIFVQAASVALIAAVTIVKGHVLGGRLEGMLDGNYGNSNDLAAAMVISLPLCLGLLFLTRNKIWKSAWALAMLAMAYVVFLTGSRAGFLVSGDDRGRVPVALRCSRTAALYPGDGPGRGHDPLAVRWRPGDAASQRDGR